MHKNSSKVKTKEGTNVSWLEERNRVDGVQNWEEDFA